MVTTLVCVLVVCACPAASAVRLVPGLAYACQAVRLGASVQTVDVWWCKPHSCIESLTNVTAIWKHRLSGTGPDLVMC